MKNDAKHQNLTLLHKKYQSLRYYQAYQVLKNLSPENRLQKALEDPEYRKVFLCYLEFLKEHLPSAANAAAIVGFEMASPEHSDIQQFSWIQDFSEYLWPHISSENAKPNIIKLLSTLERNQLKFLQYFMQQIITSDYLLPEYYCIISKNLVLRSVILTISTLKVLRLFL